MLKPLAMCASIILALSYPAFATDVPQADDVPQAVKDACQGDYDKYCSKHGHDSQAVRECMAHAFEKLSDPCVTAILDSPLADQQTPPQEAVQAEDNPQPAAVSPETTAPKKTQRTARIDHAPRIATLPPRKAHAKPAERSVHAAPARRFAHKAHAKPRTQVAKARTNKGQRHYARHTGGSKRSVADYIKRGTGIANHYVAKYTRFAFARVFR
ncbi:MAG: hypothetical protein ABL907_03825 [Hyphomicrobium sp.]